MVPASRSPSPAPSEVDRASPFEPGRGLKGGLKGKALTRRGVLTHSASQSSPSVSCEFQPREVPSVTRRDVSFYVHFFHAGTTAIRLVPSSHRLIVYRCPLTSLPIWWFSLC